MTPERTRLLLAALGTLIASLPYIVPAFAPYTELAILLGGALGGGAYLRRPGDGPAGAPAKVTYSVYGLDSADRATLEKLRAQVEQAIAALDLAGKDGQP
jgi:hypothetical protein